MSKFVESIRSLSDWFERQKRILPWRDEPTTYRVWISEIMLQQTQVVTVIPYFEKFIARFPDVKTLASAPLEDVLRSWAGLGYYSRARNLHRGAQSIVTQGRFPESREEWLEIPGVGEYTAGAILSIASDQPEAILDGNVERVLSRLRRISRARGDKAYKSRLWRLSRISVENAAREKIRPSHFNQALMELGAMVCTPKNPHCPLCPLQKSCRALASEEVENFPPKKKPKTWIEVREKMDCFVRADERGRKWQVLLRERAQGEWRAGLWDLPEQETERRARDLNSVPVFLGEVVTHHVVTRHKITRETKVWRLKNLQEKNWKAAERLELFQKSNRNIYKWVSLSDPEIAVGSALRRTLKQIRERFPEVSPQS